MIDTKKNIAYLLMVMMVFLVIRITQNLMPEANEVFIMKSQR